MQAVNDRTQDVSGDMVRLARARRAILRPDLNALDQQRASIESQMRRIQDEIAHLEGILQLHGALDDGTPPVTPHMGGRTTSDFADTVVEIVREAQRPLHFREIERQARARGIVAGGMDPANTLLAKYFNDPRLRRSARGTYELREWHPSAPSVGTHRTPKSRGAKPTLRLPR